MLNLDPHKVKLIDCSGNPNYPEATAGDVFTVSVAGKIGGASGKNVNVGNVILCLTDTIGGTEASVGTSFYVRSASNELTALSTLTQAQMSGGAILYINNATGFVTTLPATFAGMDCYVYNKTPNTSGNHTLVTATSANIMKGGTVNRAGVAGSSSAAGDTVSFVANQSIAGDFVRLTSDGTSIFVYGFADVAAGVTITQAS